MPESTVDVASIHNALYATVQMYGRLLAEQERRIQFLQAQVKALQSASHDHQRENSPG